MVPLSYWMALLESRARHEAGQRNAATFIADLNKTYSTMRFSHDWFGGKLPVWTEVFRPLRKKSPRILEVGVFEGRSIAFLMEYIPRASVVAVDHFVLKKGWTSTQNITLEWDTEEAFDSNLTRYGSRVEKVVATSDEGLRKLRDQTHRFDVIYIDAGHTEHQAYSDTVLAWDMLEAGGLFIWDDFLLDIWQTSFNGVGFGVSKWLREHPGEWEIVHAGWQVIVRKLV